MENFEHFPCLSHSTEAGPGSQKKVNDRESPARGEGEMVLDADTREEHREWRFERILDSRINHRTKGLQ
jgi:hypothetical protein